MTTHWSVVDDFALKETTPDRERAALTRLCSDYWPPLYRFVRQRGYSRHDAQDLTQGFFAYLIEKRAYAMPDRSKGKVSHFFAHAVEALPERGPRTSDATEARRRLRDGYSRWSQA